MYSPATNLFISDSISESRKRRRLQKNRKLLALLNLKFGGFIKNLNNEVEMISQIDMAFAQVKTFSGHRYGPLEIRKVG
jgi:hypothetical protein